MENLIISNYTGYINRTILDWSVVDVEENPSTYVIVIRKGQLENFFYIRRNIIKGSDLRLSEDVYELWYKDFQDSALLNSNDILDMDVVISKIGELLQKYN